MANKTNTQIVIPAKENMTQHQRTLRSIIIDERNNIIGSFENMTYDQSEEECEKYWPLEKRTKNYVVDLIYHNIMDGKSDYVVSEIRCIMLERKHIRFMGEAFVRALIEDRVEADYKKHGWRFKNRYDDVYMKPYDKAINDLKTNKYYHFKDASKERWFEIIEVKAKTVRMLELSNNKMHTYKLEGDVLKEMLEDKTATCTNNR